MASKAMNEQGLNDIALMLKIFGPEKMTDFLKTLDPETITEIDARVKNGEALVKSEAIDVMRRFSQIKGKIAPQNVTMSIRDHYDDALIAESPNALPKRVMVGFYKLAEHPNDVIYRVIKDEPPLSQVVVLKQLRPTLAQQVFGLMTKEEQVAFTVASSQCKNPSNKAIEALSRTIDSMLDKMLEVEKSPLEATIAMYATLPEDRLDEVLPSLPEDLAEAIRAATITFTDLVSQVDDVISAIFGRFNASDIAKSIKFSDEDVRNRILTNISNTKKDEVLENLPELDEGIRKEAIATQQEMVAYAKELQAEGQITIEK